MENLRFLIVLNVLSFCLLGGACSKTDHIADDLGNDEVVFMTNLAGSKETVKGACFMADSSLTDIGVFFGYTENKPFGASDRIDNFIDNVKFSRMDEEQYFKATPPRYWPVIGKSSIFGYTPYDPDFKDLMNAANYSGGLPKFRWTPSLNPAEQIDLCVCMKRDEEKELCVPMDFHHATSQIYFAANYLGLEDGEFLVIDTIILSNLVGSKVATVIDTPPYVEWEDDAGLETNAEYLLHYKFGDPTSQLDSLPLVVEGDCPEGVDITLKNGVMFLLPQICSGNASEVQVMVKYNLWKVDPVISPLPIKMRHTQMEGILPSCEWETDTRYRYILTIYDRTREIEINVHKDYVSSPAKFYAMNCVLSEDALSITEGCDTVELTAFVGPEALLPDWKKVEWVVESGVEDYFELEQLDEHNYPGTNTVRVICKKKGGPFKITARTLVWPTVEERLESTCDLTITDKGISLGDFTLDPEYNAWPTL